MMLKTSWLRRLHCHLSGLQKKYQSKSPLAQIERAQAAIIFDFLGARAGLAAYAVSGALVNLQPTVERYACPHANLDSGSQMVTGAVATKIQRMVMTDDIKTPSQIADEARQTGQKTADAAGRLANEAQAKGASAVQALRPAVEDAKATGRDALNTAKDFASDAKAIAGDAWDTARTYARNAGGVAGEKLGDFKAKASDFQETAARRIADQPIKAVAIGVAAGALLAALVLRRGRDKRDY